MSSSVFANVEQGANIEVFALTASYTKDTFENKVNLSVGGELNDNKTKGCVLNRELDSIRLGQCNNI